MTMMDNRVQTICSLLFLCFVCSFVKADTPANCTYEDIRGKWELNMGPGNNNRNVNCSGFSSVTAIKVELAFPDVAIDEYGNRGFWTMIYNQGFEVVIGGRKYFAFAKYEGKKSFCGETMVGTSHDLLGRDWACYMGKKTTPVPVKINEEHDDLTLRFGHGINSDELVRSINRAGASWTAQKYEQWNGLSHEDFVRMAGGKMSKIARRPRAAPLTEEQKAIRDSLPVQFDWRNVNGRNFVSPVRNQGACGSCYSFASLAMNEARIKILSNNTQTPVFAPQDIVECSSYAQGCEGGFPYLIGGKYAEDYGLVEESWNPYKGKDGACTTDPKAPRHYSTHYRYVGGYYGACNEAVMMEAIYNNGPIAIGFEVYNDFMSYQSGIYHHVFESGLGKFTPFELTNHAVLVVGWGKDVATGQKYWIVKNSWGENWGIDGYFWIKRGNDECALESMAVEAFPMITFNH